MGHRGEFCWEPNERLVRYYATQGLMDKPIEKHGRTAIYSVRHVLQLLAIKLLQSDGLSHDQIGEQVTRMTDSELEELVGLPEGWGAMFAEKDDSVSDDCDSCDRSEHMTAGKVEGAGMVITFNSAKAGVGMSSLALNFALMCKTPEKSVVIVDLDLDYGDIAILSNFAPDKTMSMLFGKGKSITIKSVMDALKFQSTTGLQYLLAPKNPTEVSLVKESKLVTLVECLRDEFDIVIIDMPGKPTDWRHSIMSMSDKIVYVVDQNLSCIKNAKLTLRGIAGSELENKVELVLNKTTDERAGITPNDVSAGLKQALLHIPNDEDNLPKSCNDGVPYLSTTQGRESDYGKSVSKLHRAVTCLI